MQRTSKIIDCFGNPGRLKLQRIRVHQANGAGKWEGDTFVFHLRGRIEQAEHTHRVRNSPAFGRAVELRPEHICDSGFSMLRYPLASGSSGLRFPALARRGAGI